LKARVLSEKQQQRRRQVRFVRYGNGRSEKPGVLDRDGKIRDLSSAVADLNGATLGRESLAKLKKLVILEPGDVITTGTPPGVGLGMKPPKFLKAGDRIALGIGNLGVQRQTVVET
jgi:hypothetical protein